MITTLGSKNLDLSEHLADEARSVIRELPHNLGGFNNRIWLWGSLAIKAPRTSRMWTKDERDVRYNKLMLEAEIGRDLSEQGLNVPFMYGISQCEDENNTPFLVMSKLNLTDLDKLTRQEKTEAIRQYCHQIALAKSLGYIPKDTYYLCNTRFDREKGKMFLFDFETWKKY